MPGPGLMVLVDSGMSSMDCPQVVPYPEDGKSRVRLDAVRNLFRSKFGREPEIFVRVPGRVNLIGEHVDYCGYSVCPMAIEQDIVFAAATAPADGPFLKLVNSQPQAYPDITIPNRKFDISLKRDGWAAYVLCGVKGVVGSIKELANMEIAVSGRVPPGSGLSSSSALVCASLLTTAKINNISFTKYEMADLSASCERFIGMEGGGMDQAIAFLACKGCAKHIEFNPLKTTDVKLPENAVFVIGHSLVTKKKAETSEYNTRVAECRLASQVIAKKCGIPWKSIRKVVDIQNALSVTLNELMSLITKHLRTGTYTKAEICEILEVTEEELNQVSLNQNTHHIQKFVLRERMTHVASEAHRVAWWLKETTIEGLGNLMTASHNSMARDYEASDPACDRLVELAMNAGAAGARVTGAGWGGCVVALTTRDHLDDFISQLRQTFYKDYPGDVDEVLFPSEPQAGAYVVKP
uniref:N-acetylgalactosamine kinase n=1 Tax=Lygus hesperus TaxID=30085 RepID=A0A146M3Q9_LYGHE